MFLLYIKFLSLKVEFIFDKNEINVQFVKELYESEKRKNIIKKVDRVVYGDYLEIS